MEHALQLSIVAGYSNGLTEPEVPHPVVRKPQHNTLTANGPDSWGHLRFDEQVRGSYPPLTCSLIQELMKSRIPGVNSLGFVPISPIDPVNAGWKK